MLIFTGLSNKIVNLLYVLYVFYSVQRFNIASLFCKKPNSVQSNVRKSNTVAEYLFATGSVVTTVTSNGDKSQWQWYHYALLIGVGVAIAAGLWYFVVPVLAAATTDKDNNGSRSPSPDPSLSPSLSSSSSEGLSVNPPPTSPREVPLKLVVPPQEVPLKLVVPPQEPTETANIAKNDRSMEHFSISTTSPLNLPQKPEPVRPPVGPTEGNIPPTINPTSNVTQETVQTPVPVVVPKEPIAPQMPTIFTDLRQMHTVAKKGETISSTVVSHDLKKKVVPPTVSKKVEAFSDRMIEDRKKVNALIADDGVLHSQLNKLKLEHGETSSEYRALIEMLDKKHQGVIVDENLAHFIAATATQRRDVAHILLTVENIDNNYEHFVNGRKPEAVEGLKNFAESQKQLMLRANKEEKMQYIDSCDFKWTNRLFDQLEVKTKKLHSAFEPLFLLDSITYYSVYAFILFLVQVYIFRDFIKFIPVVEYFFIQSTKFVSILSTISFNLKQNLKQKLNNIKSFIRRFKHD